MIVVLIVIAAAIILGPAVVGGALALGGGFLVVAVAKFWPLMAALVIIPMLYRLCRWTLRTAWRACRWLFGYRRPPAYVAAMRGQV